MTDQPSSPDSSKKASPAARKKPRAARRFGNLRRVPLLMVITSALAGLGIVQMTFLLGQGAYRALNWSAEARAIEAENGQLRRDIAVLSAVRDQAATPEYLRDLARCQGFVGAREEVVVAEDASVTAQGNCESVKLP